MALSLASLPPELIQLILRQCDPTSFLQAAFSCRAFLENASSSRDLTIHQLQNSPGTSAQDLEHLSHDQLFQRLLQISHRELYGAEFGSPSKLHTFGGRVIDAGASVLTAVGTLNQALLVFKGDSTVYLAKVDGGKFSLNRRIESPAKKYGKVDILHTALDSHGISVLHRLTPDEPNTKSSFVKHALESNTIFLARYDFQSDLETIMLYTFSKERDYDPLSFAAYEDKFAICWKHKTEEHTHRVNLYSTDYLTDLIDDEEEQESNALADEENDDDKEDHQIIKVSYRSILLSETINRENRDDLPQLKGPSVNMTFNDRGLQLLHYYRAKAIFGSFHRIHSPEHYENLSARHNECSVQFSTSLSLGFSIGIPFFGTHLMGNTWGGDTRAGRCHWRYLSVGFATHRVEKWTVACILMSESFPQTWHCTHEMNLERGRRFDQWTIVAQLGGFQESVTSQGPLIATSQLGTRVAIASWRTVTIWPLNPHSVILYSSEDYDDFYPESWQSEAGHLELRPVIIQLDAVCFKLQFTDDENKIIALTDKGLLFLQLDPNGKAVRVVDPSGIEDLPCENIIDTPLRDQD